MLKVVGWMRLRKQEANICCELRLTKAQTTRTYQYLVHYLVALSTYLTLLLTIVAPVVIDCQSKSRPLDWITRKESS